MSDNGSAPLTPFGGDAPEFGKIKELRPGVFWAQLPLPFWPNQVAVWLLRDGDGWTIVDAGYNNDEHRAIWRALLGQIGTAKRIILTHGHADHATLAGWLAKETGAPIVMTRIEWLSAEVLRTGPVTEYFLQNSRKFGCSEEIVASIRQERPKFKALYQGFPQQFEPISDGDYLSIDGEVWEVIAGGGHSFEMAGLFRRSDHTFIAADHLLTEIAPVVSESMHESGTNPLARQFQMLDRLTQLPAETFVLPSHGQPFVGVHARVASTRQTYLGRAALFSELVTTQMTAFEVAMKKSNRGEVARYYFRVSDAFTMLTWLAQNGTVSKTEQGGTTVFRPLR